MWLPWANLCNLSPEALPFKKSNCGWVAWSNKNASKHWKCFAKQCWQSIAKPGKYRYATTNHNCFQTTNSPTKKHFGKLFPYEKFFCETKCQTIHFLLVCFPHFYLRTSTHWKIELRWSRFEQGILPGYRKGLIAQPVNQENRGEFWNLFENRLFRKVIQLTPFTTWKESQQFSRRRIYIQST